MSRLNGSEETPTEATQLTGSYKRQYYGNLTQGEDLTLKPQKVPTEDVVVLNSSKRTRRQWVVLITLSFGNLFNASCISLQSPFFPQEAESKGSTPTEYGLVFGIYELAVFVLAPIVGKLLSHVSPKFMLTSGAFLLGGACILFGVIDRAPSGVPFLALAFAIRIVEGFGAACFTTSSFTVIAAEFPDNVASTFAVLETAFGIGLIVGPTLGGALFELGGYTLPFVVVGVLFWSCAAFAAVLMPAPDRRQDLGGGNVGEFWAHPATILPALAIVTSFVCIGYLSAVLEPHLRQFELPPFLLGVVFITNGAVYAGTAPIAGWLCDKKVSPKLVWIVGCVFTCIFLLFVGPAPFFPMKTYLWLVILSLVLFGLGNSCVLVSSFLSVLRDTLNRRSFPDNISTYGLVSSVFSTSLSFGAFAGPSIGGYLLETVGFRWGTMVLLGMELLMLMSSIAFYVLYEKNHQEAPSEKVKLLKDNKKSHC